MRSLLQNTRGDTVDPVPWIVVCGLAFLLSYAYLPLVLLELGFDIGVTFVAVTILFAGAVAISYTEQILDARPDLAGEVPAHVRMRRLLIAFVIGVVAMLSLQVAMVLF